MSDWKTYIVSELENSNLLKVEDGNHGEYRPRSNEFEEQGTPFIRSADIDNNRILFESADKINQVALDRIRKGLGKPGDILFSSKGTIGKIAIAPMNCEAFVCSPQVTFWRSLNSDFLDRWFLYYYIRSYHFHQQVNARCRETDMAPYISLTNQREFKISVPDIKEQKGISAILWCLDRKIENLRRQNETLEAIAQTLFKHWFVDFEFPNEDGKPYKSSGGAMEQSELGEIPAGWHVGKLGDKVETLGGGTPSTTISEYWENGDIFWYSPTDLTRSKTLFSLGSEKKITELGLEKSSARLFPKYSLLLTSRATIGEITINTQDACTNQGFITIVPNETFSVYFLYGWLLTQINLIKQLASGSTFPEISKSTFRNFYFLMPDSVPLTKYNQVIKPVFQKIENNVRQIQTLTKTRDVLLPKLMSGKLRIKN